MGLNRQAEALTAAWSSSATTTLAARPSARMSSEPTPSPMWLWRVLASSRMELQRPSWPTFGCRPACLARPPRRVVAGVTPGDGLRHRRGPCWQTDLHQRSCGAPCCRHRCSGERYQTGNRAGFRACQHLQPARRGRCRPVCCPRHGSHDRRWPWRRRPPTTTPPSRNWRLPGRSTTRRTSWRAWLITRHADVLARPLGANCRWRWLVRPHDTLARLLGTTRPIIAHVF